MLRSDFGEQYGLTRNVRHVEAALAEIEQRKDQEEKAELGGRDAG